MKLYLHNRVAKSYYRPHRSHRPNPKMYISFMGEVTTDFLYYTGMMTERRIKNFFRAVRKSLRRGFRGFGRAVAGAAAGFAAAMKSLGTDLASPFVFAYRQIADSAKVLKATKGRDRSIRKQRVADAMHANWMQSKTGMKRFCNYLLPALSVLVVVLAVSSISHLQFALKVTYNGAFIGNVADEQVIENAKNVISERLVMSDPGDVDLQQDVSFSVTVADEDSLSSDTALADSMLTVSGNDITEATGLYIGGKFYGATVASDMLKETLESILQPYKDAVADESDTIVRFANKVETVDGVYPSDSVLSWDEMEQIITDNEASNIYYEVQDGDTVASVCETTGLTEDEFAQLNPGITDPLTSGTQILVSQGQALLSVETVRTVTHTEEIEYDTVEVEDSRYY
ncbi:MAG: LysM peptidoglycan-binding domain-containing protein, partial [Oscillospiraceae bacterium]